MTQNKNHSAKTTPHVILTGKDKNKPETDLRGKEEGFSIYLMGANEERLKNLRKKEQIEKIMQIRSNNNSKSIATRKKWDQVTPKSPSQILDRSKSKEIKNLMSNNSKFDTRNEIIRNKDNRNNNDNRVWGHWLD